MKKNILILLSLFAFLSVKAQVAPIYLYGNQVTTDRNKATSYAIYGKVSTENVWTFKRFDLYDNLLQTGSYEDESLSTPHGNFNFYMDVQTFNSSHKTSFKLKGKTRFLSQQGNFVHGIEQGKWILFYPDGNVLSTQNYVNGELHGEFKTFDKFGNVEEGGNYVNGKKDGEWISLNGTRKDVYELGVLKSSVLIKEQTKKEKRITN
jgi:antitoxin component YwqK of YwqJK toxin-antitoxin module